MQPAQHLNLLWQWQQYPAESASFQVLVPVQVLGLVHIPLQVFDPNVQHGLRLLQVYCVQSILRKLQPYLRQWSRYLNDQ